LQENYNLAHYLKPIDKGNLQRVIEEGSKDDGTDLHSLNAKVCGISRGDGKAVWFNITDPLYSNVYRIIH